MGFYPTLRYIENITNGNPTVVEFTAAHQFTAGEFVSFRVSKKNGMVEMNNLTPIVTETTTFTITVPIDSINFTPFVTPLTPVTYPAMVVPAGSGVIPQSIPVTVNLQDCFDNKPPR